MLQTNFKLLQICSIRTVLFQAQKFEIKFGWKALEIRINIPYRNFSIFEIEFELKIQRRFYG
jgi:hypothetical protein